MRIDQLLPCFAAHDAIGNHARQLRKALRSAGVESDIYAEAVDSRVRAEAHDFAQFSLPRGDDTFALYHASTHSAMASWLASSAAESERVSTDYHNITPSSYFARWEPDAASSMEEARNELSQLAPHVSLALADSEFNEAELRSAGYARTATSPLLVDLDEYHRAPAPATLARLERERAGGGMRWLFVGRVAPNKCQHDVMAAFALYRRAFDPKARLTLVGGATSLRYLKALHDLAAELSLGDSVEILDNVAFADLLAYYAVADVFVCMSEHEGFCVPVLEAMELGVPVVAYAAAAVPATVGDAGTLLECKDPLVVACAVDALAKDVSRREGLTKRGVERARELSLPVTSARFVSHLLSWARESA